MTHRIGNALAGVAFLSALAAVVQGSDLTEKQAVTLVRHLPEFREFQRLTRKHHSAVDITDNELVTDPTRIEPSSVGSPVWRVRVMHDVIDDPATGDGHWILWNEFLVHAQTREIFVWDRSQNPFRYLPIEDWRKARHDEPKPNQAMQTCG